MLTLDLTGSPAKILAAVQAAFPTTRNMPEMGSVRRQLLGYQMAALYGLARQYDRPAARILEIGTGHGASGCLLALAAPRAVVTSLTTSRAEALLAADLWRRMGCGNIRVEVGASWDYLSGQPAGRWSMVFVDGDHNRIAHDMPWWDRLAIGGLMLWHDYSPAASAAPSPIVYQALNAFAARLGRGFDVRLVDDSGIGMVGLYRRAGETWA